MVRLEKGDCLEVMDRLIKEGVKVDAIITDPPYGTTACKWDTIIPFNEMWDRLKLLRNDNTPIVLFGSEPFSSNLRMSNIKEYKYDWIWIKERATGFNYSKYQPMRKNENISVFYKKTCFYNNEGEKLDKPYKHVLPISKSDSSRMTSSGLNEDGSRKYAYYTHKKKDNIINIKREHNTNNVHPTQKPVKLIEYLIKTYTNEGDTILDFTMGSGTTGVACKNLNRNFIGIELDEKYFNIAKDRIDYANENKTE